MMEKTSGFRSPTVFELKDKTILNIYDQKHH